MVFKKPKQSNMILKKIPKLLCINFVLVIYCWTWGLPLSGVCIPSDAPLEKLIFPLWVAVYFVGSVLIKNRNSSIIPISTLGLCLVWNCAGPVHADKSLWVHMCIWLLSQAQDFHCSFLYHVVIMSKNEFISILPHTVFLIIPLPFLEFEDCGHVWSFCLIPSVLLVVVLHEFFDLWVFNFLHFYLYNSFIQQIFLENFHVLGPRVLQKHNNKKILEN